MDLFDEYAPQVAQLYSIIQPYLTSTLKLLFSVQRYIELLLQPHLNSLAQWAYASPTLLVATFFVLLLFIMYQIISLLQRLVAFWLRLIVKLTLWAVAAAILAILWQRGWEKSLAGLESRAREIGSIYWREYERWEKYGNSAYGKDYGPRMGKPRYMDSFR